MVDVGNKLIGQFADCLAGKLAEGDPSPEPAVDVPPEPAAAAEPAAVAAADQQTPATKPRPIAVTPAEPAPIDLLGSAGPAVAKRLVPLLAGLVLLLVVIRRLRR